MMSSKIPALECIAAILPCYGTNGDTTTIITTDGKSNNSPMGIRTIIRRIAFSRATDLVALKHRTAQVTRQALLLPLPLCPGLVLCPVKVRTPRIAGDTSIGYINFHAVVGVKKFTKPPYQAIILLSGSNQVPVLWRKTTVIQHLQTARLAIVYSPISNHTSFRENHNAYQTELFFLIQKFIEISHVILAGKSIPANDFLQPEYSAGPGVKEHSRIP